MTKLVSRARQRGSAMLVTMIVIAALLAGAGVLVAMQLGSNHGSDLTRSGMSSMYCAEAGLVAARPFVAANYPSWNSSLTLPGQTPVEPAWLYNGITAAGHDIDNPADGVADFMVYLRDNDDENAPAPNDPSHDSDLRVFIVSRCLKYTDTVQEVEELVHFTGGGQCYNSQEGGCGGNGNAN
jgi:hypothetical protein